MKYQLAVFDLDGTILNTLEDLRDSVNYALAAEGFPGHTLQEIRDFVGNGIRKLIDRAVPKNTPAEQADKVFDIFKEYYGRHCADKTKPYEGIPELLKELKKTGMRLAVISNKADYAVKILCDRYFPGIFDAAYGARENIEKKPAPAAVFNLLKEFSIHKENAVYIGDSEVDIKTAENAGMDMIIVTWGFREKMVLLQNGAENLVSSPEEILAKVKES